MKMRKVENVPEPTEFFEAQVTSDGAAFWTRIGGRTLEQAHKAIALSMETRGTAEWFLGRGVGIQYRIRRFRGTVDTVEVSD